MSRLWAVLFGISAILSGAATPSTTVAGAVSYTYDVPVVARNYVPDFPVAEASRVQASNATQDAASPAAAAQRASTTPPAPVVATNTATSSMDDLLQPGGSLIGKAGTDVSIREITGGLPDAQAMFQQLSRGGTIVEQTPTLTRVQLPNGGFVQLRTVMARSPATAATIDVNIPGLDITKFEIQPMNRDEVIIAVVVSDKIRSELDDDYVGFWKVPWHLRRALPNATDEAVRDLAEAILAGLISLGAVLGDLDGESGAFIPWPPSGALDAAMTAWSVLGREPNIGDVAWLARSW